jgi:hypothetical protein
VIFPFTSSIGFLQARFSRDSSNLRYGFFENSRIGEIPKNRLDRAAGQAATIREIAVKDGTRKYRMAEIPKIAGAAADGFSAKETGW